MSDEPIGCIFGTFIIWLLCVCGVGAFWSFIGWMVYLLVMHQTM